MRKMCLLSFLLLLLTLPFLVHGSASAQTETLRVMVYDRENMPEEYGSCEDNAWVRYIQSRVLRELDISPASLETVNILAAKERELRIRTIMCPAENFDEEWDRCVAAYLSAGGSRAIEAKRSAYRESIAEKKGN